MDNFEKELEEIESDIDNASYDKKELEEIESDIDNASYERKNFEDIKIEYYCRKEEEDYLSSTTFNCNCGCSILIKYESIKMEYFPVFNSDMNMFDMNIIYDECCCPKCGRRIRIGNGKIKKIEVKFWIEG